MRGERAAFLAGIHANPQDDLCRLVYADWLDENGEADRAAVIRLMLTAPKTKAGGIDSRTKDWKRIQDHVHAVHPGFQRVCKYGVFEDGGEVVSADYWPPPGNDGQHIRVSYARGLALRAEATTSLWMTHATAVLNSAFRLTVRILPRWGASQHTWDLIADWDQAARSGRTVAPLMRRWPRVAVWEVRLVREGVVRFKTPDQTGGPS